jgi:site-specific recombinase XerD
MISQYIDSLMNKGLRPKTINCHLQRVREFYHYLLQEEELLIPNPVKRGYSLRMPKPLPKHLGHEQVDLLLNALNTPRDRAMFMIMLRCGLRVAEVADLSLSDIDLRRQRLLIRDAKWAKDRVVYVSDDATRTLVDYLKVRPPSKTDKGLSKP